MHRKLNAGPGDEASIYLCSGSCSAIYRTASQPVSDAALHRAVLRRVGRGRREEQRQARVPPELDPRQRLGMERRRRHLQGCGDAGLRGVRRLRPGPVVRGGRRGARRQRLRRERRDRVVGAGGSVGNGRVRLVLRLPRHGARVPGRRRAPHRIGAEGARLHRRGGSGRHAPLPRPRRERRDLRQRSGERRHDRRQLGLRAGGADHEPAPAGDGLAARGHPRQPRARPPRVAGGSGRDVVPRLPLGDARRPAASRCSRRPAGWSSRTSTSSRTPRPGSTSCAASTPAGRRGRSGPGGR